MHISGERPRSQMSCREAQHPQIHFTCEPDSCQGSTQCQCCVSHLTNVYLSSVECINYNVDSNGNTNCVSLSKESFTCSGKCYGSASCGQCSVEPDAPSQEPRVKFPKQNPQPQPITDQGVTTWLAWD
ncbi:hypothetical protein O181_006824 [Austropuccinia psidii MF-1]|uniref:Uncharacterized protein n=1 Tax=Austropuccinia psidii MF-1 TaxID=1389203 RepID=A0A9Q3GH95_9BASI|nr:hypothetical protein [Austropuccinia psidii MF-1]